MRARRGVVAVGIVGLVVVGAALLSRGRPTVPPPESAVPATRPRLNFPPRPRRHTAPFDWLVQPGLAARRVAGRVVHRGAPVPKATVRLTTGALRVGEHVLATVTADDAGRFDLGARAAADYHVVAQADGLVAGGVDVDLRAVAPDPRPDALVIELRDCGATVSGTVRDAGGGSIAFARVRAATFAETFVSATANEDGAYRLCLARGAAHVEAAAAGYGTALRHVRARSDVTVDFALSPEAVIAGRVVDDNGVVPGATVVAETNGHDPGVVTDSDGDGVFRIEGLVPATYRVVARDGDRLAAATVELVAAGVTRELTLTLGATTALGGRVLAAGRPVAGAMVLVKDESWVLGSAVAQDDGRFAISGLPRRAAAVSVAGHKLITPDATVDLATVREVELVCEKLPRISGRVVRGGRPLADAQLWLYGAASRPPGVHSRGDGGFVFEGVAPGEYRLKAVSAAEGASTEQPVSVAARDVDDLVLELANRASIAGVVVDGGGAPVAGVTVGFYRERDHGTDVTAADGTFTVTALAGDGEYHGYVRTERHEQLRAGEPVRVNVADATSTVTGVRLVVPRGGLSITGRAMRNGRPAVGATVEAATEQMSRATQTGVDGSFRFDDLVAGRYAVSGQRNLPGDVVYAEAGAHDVRVELYPLGSIHGTLRGFRVTPVVAAAVGRGGVYLGHGDSPQVSGVRADVQGDRFTIDGLPVGSYEVRAVSSDGTSARATVTVAADAAASVILEGRAPARLVATVTNWRTREPLAGVSCTVNSENGEVGRSATTGPAGELDVTVLAGTLRVGCYLPDTAAVPARDTAVELKPGETARIAVELLVVRRDAWRQGEGVFVSGAPPAPTRITALHGPAAASGLQVGDTLRRIDDRDVAGLSLQAIQLLFGDREPGSAARVTVERDGAELTVEVVNLEVEAPPAPGR